MNRSPYIDSYSTTIEALLSSESTTCGASGWMRRWLPHRPDITPDHRYIPRIRREEPHVPNDPVPPKPPDLCRPVPSESVPWKEWSEGTRFGSRYRHLTSAAVGPAYHVGVQIEELPPGKQTSPAHYHLREEEHVLVLEGTCTLRLGEERHALRGGDYVCFPAGQRAGHCLVNEGTAPCRLLVIGERSPDEVCVYTDSGKVLVRRLGEIYDRGALRAYWDGEATG